MAQHTLGNITLLDGRGKFPSEFAPVPLEEKRLIIVHHTATGRAMKPDALWEAHKTYGGIGYNALVYSDGRMVYVGDWNTCRAGAGQSHWLNWAAYHLAFVDNLSDNVPTAEAASAMRSLIANLQYARGLRLPVAPHCLFNVDTDAKGSKWNTECPGKTWPFWWGRIIG